MKILFLDIDGVLNNHAAHANGYCGIDPALAAYLGSIVGRTGCKIVLASAWRYLVLCEQMTVAGFGSMLLTHGVPRNAADSIVGSTERDGSTLDPHDRGRLCRLWLTTTGRKMGVLRAVALDDGSPAGDLGYAAYRIALHRPDSGIGLTADGVNEVCNLFVSLPSIVPYE